MKKVLSFILFLIFNFLALAIGGFSTADAVFGDWYINLNKAPWTPPGWVFGFAWTLVMFTFSIFMQRLWFASTKEGRSKVLYLYLLQLVFNVIWNPVFFSWHLLGLSLVVILALFFILIQLLRITLLAEKFLVLLLSPYLIWLCIAISLNAYAFFCN